MRKLQTSDVFAAMRVLKKSNIREELKGFIKKINESGIASVEDVGIDGILYTLEIFSENKCETALYEVLSGPFEVTAEDVGKMELEQLIENLQTLSKENNLKSFFTLLAGTMGLKQST